MGPKRNANDLPKAVKEFKELLEKEGKAVSPAAVAAAPTAQRQKAMTAMRNALEGSNDKKFREYKNLEGNEAKHEWLADYIIDPAQGGAIGRNWTERTNSRVQQEEDEWLTLAQIGGPLHLNDMKHAELAVQDCESRPHRKPKLAAAGVLEYHWTEDKTVRTKGLTSGVSVATSSEMTAEQYSDVKEHMEDPRNPGHAPPMKSKRQRVGDPQEKSPVQLAVDAVNKAVNHMKTTHDKINSELSKICLIEKKLKEKKWDTTGPLKFLQDETEKVRKANKVLGEKWAAAVEYVGNLKGKKDEDIDVDAVKAKQAAYDELSTKHMNEYKAYSKECLSELSK